jgi:hypothetical protein
VIASGVVIDIEVILEEINALKTELANLQTAGRISQMMIQQLLTNIKSMGDDLGYALNQLSELQYKQTALQKYLNCDAAGLDKIANEQRLIDFNKGSAEQDKKDISEARYAALEKAVVDGEKDTIKHMIGTMDGKDLLKANDKILLNEEAIKNMKISQLKTMEEEGLDSAKKAVIKSAIQVQAITGGHSAFGWVNKNWSTTS